VIRGSLIDQTGIKWELNYKLIELDGAYSIGIEKSGQGKAVKREIIYEETKGLTYNKQEAEAWLHKLAAGRVTPISLHDIVDDLTG